MTERVEIGLIRQLRDSYGYRTFEDRRQVFVDLVVDEISRCQSPRVLDVGCGEGISASADGSSFVKQVRDRATVLWGLDPALTRPPQHGLLDEFRHGTAEEAGLPSAFFDVAYSFMVLEHVDKPIDFFRAIQRTLKPGGSFVLCTVNARHYFTRIARLARLLRIDEAVLRIVKGAQVEEYHFPTRYRCNSEPRVQAAAQKAGFESVSVAYSEEAPPLAYFPGPLRLVPFIGECRRPNRPRAENLLTMYIVARKAEES